MKLLFLRGKPTIVQRDFSLAILFSWDFVWCCSCQKTVTQKAACLLIDFFPELPLWKPTVSDSLFLLVHRFQFEKDWFTLKVRLNDELALESQVVWGYNQEQNWWKHFSNFHVSQYILLFLQMKIFDKNKDGCLDLNDLARYFSASRIKL